jgi:2,3-bisphosphoglycerate-independent phosphoglycerate mutase
VVEVVVIPDGAAQPVRGDEPTALEIAWKPAMDELAGGGSLVRVAVTPQGLPAGSETGIPTLLGCPPAARVGRGRVDAVGHGIDVRDGVVPWRADLLYGNGRRASIRQVRDICSHLGPSAVPIGGHRLLLLAETRPADRRILGLRLRVWDDGPTPAGVVPRATTMVCARGTAAGCARLLGANVTTPAGATGDVDTDLAGKLNAALEAIAADCPCVVVHVGAPDEAAHRGERAAVVAALEAIDAQLVAPLREAVEEVDGRLVVCPDHGTDPLTGRHDRAPVPAIVWPGRRDAEPGERYSERLARAAPLLEADELFAGVAA